MISRFMQSKEALSGTVLLLQVPRTNEKKELAAEQMFATLHGLLSDHKIRERISCEIAVKDKRIGFYIWVPTKLKNFVEEQVYAQYPSVDITEVVDYAMTNAINESVTIGAELKLMSNEALPIKTFPSFEVDPLAAITATLAQFGEHEEAWLQLLVRPAPEAWHKRSERFASNIRNGNGNIFGGLWVSSNSKPESTKLAEHESARANAAEEKSHKLAYEVTIRVIYRGQNTTQARMRLQAITATFKQFNTTYLNGFSHKINDKPVFIDAFRNRSFMGRGFVCNIEEIASLYHLPHTNVETPNILWANAKTAEPPANLTVYNQETSSKVSPIGFTNFRGQNTMFGVNRSDRGRHMYIIGQTGVGKSGLLELLTISDIYSPYGFAVVDPHGDYALNILRRIPAERAGDVIYFNPADTDFPIAFNPMEVLDKKLKSHTATELIGVLKRMFESWGPRLEYILRYSLLALLDYPDATMLDITRILTDKKFRMEVLEYVEDPVVRNFWLVEFASWNDKFAAEAVAPVLNKVGAFTANPIVRNIIGQPKSSFNIRQIMDERKILIVNLSRGLIGEDNAALLGALLVTKIQMGAMSRADIDLNERVPFYLYVDEFQNFATDSFATILSEARKYALNLTVANQYIAQMMDSVKDAVFGNVGSIVTFRTSADDARTMLKYFEPKFEEHDLVHMHNRHFVVSMTIEGEKVQAFSATTLNLPEQTSDFSSEIIARSRQMYAIDRGKIETFMHERYVTPEKQHQQSPPKMQTQKTPEAPKKSISPKKVAEDILKLTGTTPQPQSATQTTKPKRKRTRPRRKQKQTEVSPRVDTPTQHKPDNDETVIHLR